MRKCNVNIALVVASRIYVVEQIEEFIFESDGRTPDPWRFGFAFSHMHQIGMDVLD